MELYIYIYIYIYNHVRMCYINGYLSVNQSIFISIYEYFCVYGNVGTKFDEKEKREKSSQVEWFLWQCSGFTELLYFQQHGFHYRVIFLNHIYIYIYIYVCVCMCVCVCGCLGVLLASTWYANEVVWTTSKKFRGEKSWLNVACSREKSPESRTPQDGSCIATRHPSHKSCKSFRESFWLGLLHCSDKLWCVFEYYYLSFVPANIMLSGSC